MHFCVKCGKEEKPQIHVLHHQSDQVLDLLFAWRELLGMEFQGFRRILTPMDIERHTLSLMCKS